MRAREHDEAFGWARQIALMALGCILLLLAASCEANRTPAGGPDAGGVSFGCLPDLDGEITGAELPLALELPVEYWVSPDGASVDLAGTTDEAGRRLWDFSTESPADERVTTAARPLAGAWYADSFPAGQFVVPALAPGDLAGVYSRDEGGVWLHGLASPSPDPPGGQTLLPYQEPVLVLRFPLRPGESWISTGTVSGGTLDGLPYNGTDTYQVEVDALGRLKVPSLAFTQAHRVRTRVEVEPAAGGVTASRRQTSFFFECFGEVVRAVSREGEPSPDFTTAAELRRFAL